MSAPAPSPAARVLRHGGAYAGCGLAERAIALAMVPIYAHYLGATGYGIVAVLGAITPLLAIVYSQGLIPAWVRLRLDHPGAAERRRFQSTLFWYLLLTAAALLAGLAAFGEGLAAWIAPGIPFYPLVVLAFATAAVTLFSELYRRHLQAEQDARRYVRFTGLRLGATAAAVVVFVVPLGLGPLGKLAAEGLVALAFAAFAIARLRPLPPGHGDRAVLRRSIAYGLPLVPHSLLTHLNQAAGRILVAHVLGLAATGVFSLGLAVAQLGTAVAIAFNQAYQPIFFDGVKRAERLDAAGGSGRELREGVARTALWIVCAVAGLALALTAAAREVLAAVASAEFAQSWRVVAPLSAAAVAIACNHVLGHSVVYTAAGTRRIAWITAVTALVNVGGALWLLPRVGVAGAAWALLAAHSLQALLVAALGRRILPMPHPVGRWLGLLATTAVGLAALAVLDASIGPAPLRVPAKLAVLGACFGAAVLASGLPVRRGLGALGLRSVP